MQWSDVNFRPATATLRQFAALAVLFLLGIGGWQYVAHGRHLLAVALVASALAVAALGVARPQAIRWLFVGLTLATFPLGWLMSWLLMGGIYYLMFTPISIYFRLTGRDALRRRYDDSAESYWTEKPRVTDVRRYFRQF